MKVRIRSVLTLLLPLLGTCSSTTDLCKGESIHYSYEQSRQEFTYTLERVLSRITTIDIFEVVKEQQSVTIPKTEGCSVVCHNRTGYDSRTEVVCDATDTGASFSVNHTTSGDQGFDTQLMCSKGQTPNGHTEIKCDTARRGNILTVAINLQPTAIVKCSLYTFTEFGVIVKCFSSLFKIHGMAYFINGLPISVTCDSRVLIGWENFSPHSKLSLSVSVSNGELYHISFFIERPPVTGEVSECEVKLSHDIRDLGEEIELTATPAGTTTEILHTTLFKNYEKINETEGQTIQVQKTHLHGGENKFLFVFVVLCGGRPFLLLRHLTLTSGCHVHCTGRVHGRNIQVVCNESSGSPEVKSITYSLKGRGSITVEGSELEIEEIEILDGERLTIQLTTTCVDGGETDVNITLKCFQPDLDCQVESSPCVAYDGVRINCSTNIPSLEAVDCSIDEKVLQNCDMDTFLDYSVLPDGQHTFSIGVTDEVGNKAKTKVIFSVSFKIWCKAVYKSGQDMITVSCDSTRPIRSAKLLINQGTYLECSLPCTLSMTENMLVTEDISIRVEGQDHFGNSASDNELHFLKME